MTRPALSTVALLALLTAAPLPFGAAAQTPAPAETPPATGSQTPATDGQAEPVPDPVNDLSLGREEGGIGSIYVAEVHGDWERRCERKEDGSDPCQLYQLLRDKEGNPVAEFTLVGLPKGQQAVVGATAIVPLETLLTQELTIQIDGGAAKKYPFAWCNPIGCFSRIGFTRAEVDAMKKGNAARLTIVPVVAPDQKVTLTMSLKGFTAGLDAVNKANKVGG